jgi:D-lactate dehydrogenase
VHLDRLGGMALDVYEEEEGVCFEDRSGQVLEDDVLARLLMFPSTPITPNHAFLAREALHVIARTTVEDVRGLAAGELFLEGTLLELGRRRGAPLSAVRQSPSRHGRLS